MNREEVTYRSDLLVSKKNEKDFVPPGSASNANDLEDLFSGVEDQACNQEKRKVIESERLPTHESKEVKYPQEKKSMIMQNSKEDNEEYYRPIPTERRGKVEEQRYYHQEPYYEERENKIDDNYDRLEMHSYYREQSDEEKYRQERYCQENEYERNDKVTERGRSLEDYQKYHVNDNRQEQEAMGYSRLMVVDSKQYKQENRRSQRNCEYEEEYCSDSNYENTNQFDSEKRFLEKQIYKRQQEPIRDMPQNETRDSTRRFNSESNQEKMNRQRSEFRQTTNISDEQVIRKPREYSYNKIAKPDAQYQVFGQKIVVVHSPKGGVGKSTLAKETARGLSSVLVNEKKLKVLLIDMDWSFADQATLFNISPYPSVSEWVKWMIEDKNKLGRIPVYEQKEMEQLVHVYSENFHILPGPENAMDAELVTPEIVNAMINNVGRFDYDIVMLDCANSIEERTLVSLRKADQVLLILTLETTTITETSIMLDTLSTMQFDFSKLKFIFNNVPTDAKKLDITVQQVERMLKMQSTAVIAADPSVRLYNNAAHSILDNKKSQTANEIMKIIHSIIPEEKVIKESFLKRLFGKKNKKR